MTPSPSPRRSRRARLTLAAALLPLAAGGAAAQRVQPEARLDALVARATSVQGGIGLSVRASRTLRLAIVGGAGAEEHGGEWRRAGRVDLLGRFSLAPAASRRWTAYIGGGGSVRLGDGPPRELLVLTLGAEAPRRGAALPFLELGLGGGVRIGIGVRRATPAR